MPSSNGCYRKCGPMTTCSSENNIKILRSNASIGFPPSRMDLTVWFQLTRTLYCWISITIMSGYHAITSHEHRIQTWKWLSHRNPFARVLYPSDMQHAAIVMPRPAILPHPELGVSDLPIISDIHKPESLKPSLAQNPDTLRVIPPLGVLSTSFALPKEEEGYTPTALVALASLGKPQSGKVHTDEMVITNLTDGVGRTLDTSSTDSPVRNTVCNEKKTPLRNDYINKTQIPLKSSSELAWVTSSTHAPSRVEKTVSPDPNMGSDPFVGDKDEESFGKNTDHVDIAGSLLDSKRDSVKPSLRDATGIWTKFGTVEGKCTAWRTFLSSDAKSKHRDASY